MKAVDVGVLCCGTTEVNNGRGVAHNFFHCCFGILVEVVPPNVALVGVIGEKFHAMANGITRCLVSSYHEQDEERTELLSGEALSINFGMHHY